MEKGRSDSNLMMDEVSMKKQPTRIPILIALVFVAATIALAIALGVVINQKNSLEASRKGQKTDEDSNSNLCLTPGCTRAASMVLENLDTTVMPCDNFYLFSCGNWMKRNVIPEDSSSYSTFGKLRDELAVQLKGLLEEPVGESEPQSLKDTQNMYKACMDEASVEKKGLAPVHDALNKMGGWPMIHSSWSESSFSLTNLMKELRLLNNRYLMDMWVSADDRDSNTNILQLDQFSLGLPGRDYFLTPKYEAVRSAYKSLIINIGTALGGNQTVVEQDAQALIEFETFLANITVPPVERRDSNALYNKMSIEQLAINVSDKIEWLSYINSVFAHVNYTFNPSSKVVVYAPRFLKLMAERVSVTENRTIANYLLMRFVLNRVSNLPKSIQDIYSKFSKVLYGTESESARWKRCANYVNGFNGFALGKLFVNKYFKEEAKNSSLEMIAGVRQAFDELLKEVDWMDDSTREIAKEKSNAIAEKIGYPDWIADSSKLNDEYLGILGKIKPDEYFQNTLNVIAWAAIYGLSNIKKPVDKERWVTTPAIVNAYYSSSRNQIAFPAGVLQPPFWDKDRPMSMNYGGIGAVIGHEITHGFDDQGRQYNKDGNLVDWWSSNVVENFKQKAQCIIDQYSSYVMPQINRTLNGRQTQGENIADNGGIKQSFRAYQFWEEKNGEGKRLPGLQQYDSKQLFFIAFGQIWCSSWRDQGITNAIETGVHSPGMYRVIGTLSNFHEFSKAFNCPVGTLMNPAKKCSVW